MRREKKANEEAKERQERELEERESRKVRNQKGGRNINLKKKRGNVWKEK